MPVSYLGHHRRPKRRADLSELGAPRGDADNSTSGNGPTAGRRTSGSVHVVDGEHTEAGPRRRTNGPVGAGRRRRPPPADRRSTAGLESAESVAGAHGAEHAAQHSWPDQFGSGRPRRADGTVQRLQLPSPGASVSPPWPYNHWQLEYTGRRRSEAARMGRSTPKAGTDATSLAQQP